MYVSFHWHYILNPIFVQNQKLHKKYIFCFTPCKVETWAPRVVYNVVSSSECNILLLPVLDPSPSNIWDRVWRKGERPDLLNLINSLAVLNQPELKLSFQLLNL